MATNEGGAVKGKIGGGKFNLHSDMKDTKGEPGEMKSKGPQDHKKHHKAMGHKKHHGK
jgi:hypothetical protein